MVGCECLCACMMYRKMLCSALKMVFWFWRKRHTQFSIFNPSQPEDERGVNDSQELRERWARRND